MARPTRTRVRLCAVLLVHCTGYARHVVDFFRPKLGAGRVRLAHVSFGAAVPVGGGKATRVWQGFTGDPAKVDTLYVLKRLDTSTELACLPGGVRVPPTCCAARLAHTGFNAACATLGPWPRAPGVVQHRAPCAVRAPWTYTHMATPPRPPFAADTARVAAAECTHASKHPLVQTGMFECGANKRTQPSQVQQLGGPG